MISYEFKATFFKAYLVAYTSYREDHVAVIAI